MRRALRWARNLLIGIALLIALGIAALLYFLQHLATTPLAPEPEIPLLEWKKPLPSGSAEPAEWEQRALADQQALFDPDIFANPPKEYQPWTRWWWPGNVVNENELVREMQVFAEQGFGGVEIQAMSADVSEIDKSDPRWGENGWNSPAFYSNVRAVLDAANDLDMRVDITAGSGWPSGGPHVGLQDGMHSLVHGEKIVKGPSELNIKLPPPKMPVHWRAMSWLNLFMPMGFFADGYETLLTVVASRVQENGRSINPLDIRDQIKLDASSSIVLDDNVDENGILQWNVPSGEWAITAFYKVPGGESGMAAIPQSTYVVDHFDSERLNAHYNYLFRAETELAGYFGEQLRGFFNDSFEFKEERLWPKEQFTDFQHTHGYDPRPHLQAIVQTGHDFSMFHWAKIEATHEYTLGDKGNRFEHDWEQSVSDSFIARFIDGSRDWAEAHNLASRTQAYGFEFDLIKAAGHTSIPETEQQGGSMLFMKMPSSGAWLYDRPLVTAESFIHKRRAWMSTPAKVKVQAQQLFAAGVNQIIYHGSPYQIQNPEQRGYPADGWYPFTSSTFSEDFSEQHPHWQQLKQLNHYIARLQYLLRLGEPEVDVLVYYPWLGFPLEGIGEDAFLVAGQFDGEPEVSNETPVPVPLPAGYHDPRETWLASVLPIIQSLEAGGLTWQWINPEKAAELSTDNGNLRLEKHTYKALLLHDTSAIENKLATHIAMLAENGASVLTSGEKPDQQPGLSARKSESLSDADKNVAAAMQRLSAHAAQLKELSTKHGLYQAKGIQQLRRRLVNGEVLIYLNNTHRKARTLDIRLPESVSSISAIDAWTGTSWPVSPKPIAVNQHKAVNLSLPAYSAIVLLVGPPGSAPLDDTRSEAMQYFAGATRTNSTQIESWQLTVENQTIALDTLGDWREIPTLQDSDATAQYSSTLNLSNPGSGRYILDLGEVFGVASVSINGKHAGEAAVVPFELDITGYLQPGENRVDIELVPPRRNARVKNLADHASGASAGIASSDRSAAGLAGPIQLQYWQLGTNQKDK